MTAIRSVLAALLACLALAAPAHAADDLIEKLATCKDSWYDNRNDEARMRALGNTFNESFKPHEKERYFVPKSKMTVLGLPVVQAYPQNVGMGLGFSLLVEANFDNARAALEKAAGKPLEHCETGDGMRSCELQIADQRTLMLMAGENGRSKTTLLGCYYFYEK